MIHCRPHQKKMRWFGKCWRQDHSVTWEEAADGQRRAAVCLLSRKRNVCPRAVCSRTYYAAYALVVARAPVGTIYPRGWQNPSHDQLPGIVQTIGTVPKEVRGSVAAAILRLRLGRENADYRPGVTIGPGSARTAMRDCEFVFHALRGR